MLLHHPNARGNGAPWRQSAPARRFHRISSAVCAVDAEEDIHEGGFAAPVFSRSAWISPFSTIGSTWSLAQTPGKGLADLLHFQGPYRSLLPVQRRSTGCTAALWMLYSDKIYLRCAVMTSSRAQWSMVAEPSSATS